VRVGVQVFTNVAGEPLSAAKIPAGVLAEWAEHDLPCGSSDADRAVFRLCCEREFGERNLVQLGWPYETTACMTRLIYSGFR